MFSVNKFLVQYQSKSSSKIVAFNIKNKSILQNQKGSSSSIVINDLNFILKNHPEAYQFFDRLTESLASEELDLTLFSKALEISEWMIQKKIPDYAKFCDQSKRSKKSIFFSEKDMKELLLLIGILKIFALFIHSNEYADLMVPLVKQISHHFKDISILLFQVIKARSYKFNLNTKDQFEFLKFVISQDFLVLYNFDFIYMTIMSHYDWTRNPVTFIVSVSTDNTNFLIMTYKSNQNKYSDDIESSTDILPMLSYELILDTVRKKVQTIPGFKSWLITSPVTDLLALPTFSLISDIPYHYLLNKPQEDKLMYQYFLYLVIKDSKLSELLGPGVKLLQYGLSESIPYRNVPVPTVLEVLKAELKYFNLDSKSPLTRVATEFSSLLGYENKLLHLVNESVFPEDVEIAIKKSINFICYLFMDDRRSLIQEVGRSLFLNNIKDVRVSSSKVAYILS
jgi:hypothetical protein